MVGMQKKLFKQALQKKKTQTADDIINKQNQNLQIINTHMPITFIYDDGIGESEVTG